MTAGTRQLQALHRDTGEQRSAAALGAVRYGVMLTSSAARVAEIQGEGALAADHVAQDLARAVRRTETEVATVLDRLIADERRR